MASLPPSFYKRDCGDHDHTPPLPNKRKARVQQLVWVQAQVPGLFDQHSSTSLEKKGTSHAHLLFLPSGNGMEVRVVVAHDHTPPLLKRSMAGVMPPPHLLLEEGWR